VEAPLLAAVESVNIFRAKDDHTPIQVGQSHTSLLYSILMFQILGYLQLSQHRMPAEDKEM